MLLKDFRIKRPKKTKIQTKGGKKYVYQVVGKTYNREKKYYTEKRVCIGRMIDDVYMMPNERFSEYYSEELADISVAPVFSDVLHVGAFKVIDTITAELHIDELLENIFDVDDATFIKDIVSYMIVTESSTFQYYPDVMRMYPIFSKKIWDDTTISRFLKRMNEQDIELFIKGWNALNQTDSVYVSYDSTNMNTAARGIEIAEYGHAKKDEDLPQINLAYAIEHSDSTPLFYELYPGSINDVSELKMMIEIADRFGYKDIGFIMDRGYFSAGNIKEMDKKGYRFIMMMKGNQSCVKDAVEEVKIKLRKMEGYYIKEHDVCGTTVVGQLFKSDKKKRYFHVYYDDHRASEERSEVLSKYDGYEKELDKAVEAKTKTEGELKKYSKAFHLIYDNNGYFKGYKRRNRYIQKEIDGLGYFTLVTSEKMTAEEALDIYRNRDNVEKVFRMIKTELDCEKYRVHSTESLKSKTFLVFIAAIIRNEIFRKTKEYRMGNRKYGTVSAIIKELDKIECTRGTNHKYTRRYVLTSKQKRILKCFGTTEKDIDKFIAQRNT